MASQLTVRANFITAVSLPEDICNGQTVLGFLCPMSKRDVTANRVQGLVSVVQYYINLEAAKPFLKCDTFRNKFPLHLTLEFCKLRVREVKTKKIYDDFMASRKKSKFAGTQYEWKLSAIEGKLASACIFRFLDQDGGDCDSKTVYEHCRKELMKTLKNTRKKIAPEIKKVQVIRKAFLLLQDVEIMKPDVDVEPLFNDKINVDSNPAAAVDIMATDWAAVLTGFVASAAAAAAGDDVEAVDDSTEVDDCE